MKRKPEMLVKLEKLNVYECKKCPKVFPNSSVLMKHKSYHDKILSHAVSAYVSVERAKILKCDKCSKTFCNNRVFMLHKLLHIQENVRNIRKVTKLFQNHDIVKPYKCPDCDVSYAAQSTLDEHSILHLPFPHICECGIGYYKKQDLKGHMKLVHGTKNKLEPALSQNLDPQEERVIPQTRPQDSPQRKSQNQPRRKSQDQPIRKSQDKLNNS